jgi:uncharacterized protein YneF (UPF0154 family)
MSKLTLFIVIALTLMVGVYLGQWSTERQFTRVYEDGSFVGCFRGGLCNE